MSEYSVNKVYNGYLFTVDDYDYTFSYVSLIFVNKVKDKLVYECVFCKDDVMTTFSIVTDNELSFGDVSGPNAILLLVIPYLRKQLTFNEELKAYDAAVLNKLSSRNKTQP